MAELKECYLCHKPTTEGIPMRIGIEPATVCLRCDDKYSRCED